jgi:hypothetical protein
MNCQQLTLLLDDTDIGRLSAAERSHVDAHLSSCGQCASEWDAHERMLAASIPAMPRHLALRCRAQLAAAAASAGKRTRARPAVLAGLLLVGAAAAAVFSIEWTDDSPDVSVVQTATDVGIAATSFGTAGVKDAPAVLPVDEPRADFAADGSAVSSAGAAGAASSGGFTVAVSPLIHEETQPQIAAITDSIYAALLDELRAVPGLVLIELDESLEEFRGGRRVGAFGFSAAPVTVSGANRMETIVAEKVMINAGSAEFATAPTNVAPTTFTLNATFIGEANGDFANASAGEPGTFTVEGEAAFAPVMVAGAQGEALVNVIVADRGAVAFDTLPGEDESRADDRTPAYDFTLNVTSNASISAGASSPDVYIFGVTGTKVGGANQRITFAMSGSVYERADVEGFARETVEQLRKTLFEPDDALIGELQTVVLDPAAAMDERVKALSELQVVANRSGRDGRVGHLVPAVVDMADRATDSGRRAQIWRLMRGANDAGLIRPLLDALLYDGAEIVRLEAARALESFAADPTVHAALEQAGGFDASAEVRKQAKWSSLSEGGRRDYIAAALRDTRLSAAERVEPLLYEVRAPGGPFSPNRQAARSLDGASAVALVDIMQTAEGLPLRSALIRHLAGSDEPKVVAFLLGNLDNAPEEFVRMMSLEALRGQLEYPGVRAAVEDARTSDASAGVRELARRILDAP